jgi:hypothetical protein
MKFLILIFFTVNANAMFFPVGKDGANTSYVSKQKCEEIEKTTCLDITGKNLAFYESREIETDDLERPIYKEAYRAESCSTEAKCREIIGKLSKDHCYKDEADYSVYKKNDVLPGFTLYCTGIKRYEKKTTWDLVLDEDKKQAHEVKLAEEESIKIQYEKMNFGRRIIALIYVQNEQKKMSQKQIGIFMETFGVILVNLRIGYLERARHKISEAKTNKLFTKENKERLLSEIDEYLKQFN